MRPHEMIKFAKGETLEGEVKYIRGNKEKNYYIIKRTEMVSDM